MLRFHELHTVKGAFFIYAKRRLYNCFHAVDLAVQMIEF